MNCPRCQLINPETAKSCDCGYSFASPPTAASDKGQEAVDPTGRIALSPTVPPPSLEQVAAILQRGFPTCLLSIAATSLDSIVGKPSRRVRWGLSVTRGGLRGARVSLMQDTTFFGRPLSPPYLEVVDHGGPHGLPHGLFGMLDAAARAVEGRDTQLVFEVLHFLEKELAGGDLRLRS